MKTIEEKREQQRQNKKIYYARHRAEILARKRLKYHSLRDKIMAKKEAIIELKSNPNSFNSVLTASDVMEKLKMFDSYTFEEAQKLSENKWKLYLINKELKEYNWIVNGKYGIYRKNYKEDKIAEAKNLLNQEA